MARIARAFYRARALMPGHTCLVSARVNLDVSFNIWISMSKFRYLRKLSEQNIYRTLFLGVYKKIWQNATRREPRHSYMNVWSLDTCTFIVLAERFCFNDDAIGKGGGGGVAFWTELHQKTVKLVWKRQYTHQLLHMYMYLIYVQYTYLHVHRRLTFLHRFEFLIIHVQ